MVATANDRRHHLRISPKGTVILLAGEYAQRGRIANIGRGGLFATTLTQPPSRLLGRAIEMELRLDGPLAQWLRVSGRITRIVGDGLAVAFADVPATLVRMLDDMASASRTRKRTISVVLIDDNLERRAKIAEGFRVVGCSVIAITTPLEAVVRLGELTFEPDLIAIADALNAEDLRHFVEREHPRVKLIGIGDETVDPADLADRLSSADPNSDLSTRVRDILVRPHR